jgi:hypothetical protein
VRRESADLRRHVHARSDGRAEGGSAGEIGESSSAVEPPLGCAGQP